jgi:hypothetical protein
MTWYVGRKTRAFRSVHLAACDSFLQPPAEHAEVLPAVLVGAALAVNLTILICQTTYSPLALRDIVWACVLICYCRRGHHSNIFIDFFICSKSPRIVSPSESEFQSKRTIRCNPLPAKQSKGIPLPQNAQGRQVIPICGVQRGR